MYIVDINEMNEGLCHSVILTTYVQKVKYICLYIYLQNHFS